MGMREQNIHWAQQAVNYVNNIVRVRASNRLGDLVGTLGSSALGVALIRLQNTPQEAAALRHARRTGDQLPQILAIADEAERGCVGNCGEMSAIAFRYLYRRHVAPLDFVQATNFSHAFVVIGRTVAPGMSERQAMDPANWGPNAAVCDPHQRAAYAASDLRRRMHPGNGMFELIVRHEGTACPVPWATQAARGAGSARRAVG